MGRSAVTSARRALRSAAMSETHTDDASAPGERVRFCLACGAMVAFDLRICPACGHVEPAPGAPPPASVTCDACGTRHAAGLQTCPGCGRETPGLWLPAPRGEPVAAASAEGLTTAYVALAWLGPLIAVLAVALALR